MRFRYVLAPAGSVDPTDRGLAYGDGLFETMAIRRGKIAHLELHFDRLRAGAARLKLPLPETAALEARLDEAREGIPHGVIKLIVTRGVGPRGYAPPPEPEPTIVLSASAVKSPAAACITVATLRQRLGENEALAGIKHLNRLEQVLGQLELASCDADEGLMLSTAGNVMSGTSRNLFAVIEQQVVTPDLRRAGIQGVMRRAILDRCGALGLAVTEVDIAPAELLRARELFMTNALVGIQSVTELDRIPLASRDVAIRLRAALGLDRDD
jgi:4-amino-4-deoxychorismate lyase